MEQYRYVNKSENEEEKQTGYGIYRSARSKKTIRLKRS